MKMTDKMRFSLWVAATVSCVLIPFLFNPETSYLVYFLFMTFVYVALSQAWNLVAGYTGQVTLGLHAFFGLGAYVIAILWSRGLIGYLDPLGMVAAGVGAAILAVLVGIPLLSKLRGDYFALGTLGLGEILRLVTIQGGSLTAGPTGIILPSSSFSTMVPHYFIGLFLAALAVGLIYYLSRSRIGLALVAVRDAEPAASASGINVLKFKVFVFAVGAAIAGLCGALQAYYVFHVEPQGFYNLNWTLYPVLMCVMGGAGTIVGPVIGAIALTAAFEVAKYFLPEIHPVFSGLLIILAIIFLPNGIMGLRIARAVKRRHAVTKGLERTSR
jgi:branched-chain amino acid transport system permease protein